MLSIAASFLIFASGLFFTVKSAFIQFSSFKCGLKNLMAVNSSGPKGISGFGALCTTLAATLGTGNIVGVSVAVCTGGPGALFWMVLSGFFGMALSYTEGFLAVFYRKKRVDGAISDGPFCYMEYGFKKMGKPIARLYAIFCAASGLTGIGTTIQVNSALSAVDNFFSDSARSVFFFGQHSVAFVFFCCAITVFTALVIIGGIRRISAFCTIAVPLMSAMYLFFVIASLLGNASSISGAVYHIIFGAFNPSAVTGGIVGSVARTFTSGVTKGVFSNEAGLGTCAISSSAVTNTSAPRQGTVCMLATFIDTVVMCSLTGVAVVASDAWKTPGLSGAVVTARALSSAGWVPEYIISLVLMLSLVIFAFTSIVGWYCYCESCVRYLFPQKKSCVSFFRFLYISAVFFGAYINTSYLWEFADALNSLMALPNIIALFFLRKRIFGK